MEDTCISPRKSSNSTTPKSVTSVGTNTETSNSVPQATKPQATKAKTVLFGSSMTRFLDEERLSSSSRVFTNVSQSGARRLPVRGKGSRQPWLFREMLENFAVANNTDLKSYDTIIFSLGTNDLRFFRHDDGTPGDLRILIKPIEQLIKRCRQLFGKSVKLLFHSVLPMCCMYTYTSPNFLGFNRLLKDICRHHNCHFIYWFSVFLNHNGSAFDSSLYRDNLHLNRDGYSVLHRLLEQLIADNYIFHANTYD